MRNKSQSQGGRPTRDAARVLDEKILAVADQLFVARGYGGTSMAGIAAEARIGKQTLYRRYPNKAALFRDVVNQRIEAASAVPDIPIDEKDPVGEVKRLARSALEAVTDDNLVTLHRVVISEVSQFPELASYAGQWGSLHTERCARAIERASALGLCTRQEPTMLATSLLWSIVGEILYRALMGQKTLHNIDERDRYFDAKWAATIFGERK